MLRYVSLLCINSAARRYIHEVGSPWVPSQLNGSARTSTNTDRRGEDAPIWSPVTEGAAYVRAYSSMS